MTFAEFRRNLRDFGLAVAAGDVALRAIKRVAAVKILKGLTIDAVNPEFLPCEARFSCGFLSPAQLRELARNPQYELTPEFLDDAFRKGDECYGFLDGDVLASYGWYSTRPTMDEPGLYVHFDPAYTYMYKGFTHPAYRGRRLHAIGMTRALQAWLSRGAKGLVTFVEWNNFSSLRSCYRMGYREFGTVIAVKLFGRYWLYASRGCRPYKFRLETTPEPPEPSPGAQAGAV